MPKYEIEITNDQYKFIESLAEVVNCTIQQQLRDVVEAGLQTFRDVVEKIYNKKQKDEFYHNQK